MRKLTWTALLAAGVGIMATERGLVPSAVAQDQSPPAAPHGTNLRSTDGSESLASVLSFACSYLAEGEPRRINYDKVTCKFATTAIGRPTAEQVTQRLGELDAAEGQTATVDTFPSACQSLTTISAHPDGPISSGPLGVYREKLSQACAAQDAALGKEALRYNITELWARTCQAFNYGVREYEFHRVDDSTWRSMGGAAASGTATIRTIWRRKDVNGFWFWNYKQVTSSDPACVPVPFGECAKDSTNEWTRDAQVTLTGCQFFN
jgi:hypothetical protein